MGREFTGGTVVTDEEMRRMIAAGQAYDYANRPPRWSWTRVPDDQVERLITGALEQIGRESIARMDGSASQ